MSKMLETLYEHVYERPELAALQESVEASHDLLRERLGESARKLVLRLIDDENMIANTLSLDSFLCGFELAWRLTNELNHLGRERTALTDEVERSAHFVSEGGEAT